MKCFGLLEERSTSPRLIGIVLSKSFRYVFSKP